jgi:hypothetical protein
MSTPAWAHLSSLAQAGTIALLQAERPMPDGGTTGLNVRQAPQGKQRKEDHQFVASRPPLTEHDIAPANPARSLVASPRTDTDPRGR